MKDRIKEYMDYKSISAGELAGRLDVQRSNISHILNGRNKPGAGFIEKLLLSYPDLNARWLLTGEGPMAEEADLKDSAVSNKPKSEAIQQEIKHEPIVQEVEQQQDNILDISGSDEPKELEKIVLLYTDGTFKDFRRK